MDTDGLIFCLVYGVFGGGYFLWRLNKRYRRRMWDAAAAKVALAVDGTLVIFIIMSRRIPFTNWVKYPKPSGIFLHTLMVIFFIGLLAVGYVALTDRATRWLIDKPRVKWPMYVVAVLTIIKLNW